MENILESKIPKLDLKSSKSTIGLWMNRMEIYLSALALRQCVLSSKGGTQKDRITKHILVSHLSDQTLIDNSQIFQAESAKDMWDIVNAKYQKLKW